MPKLKGVLLMTNNFVKNIVIVGGGTAGWMSAAALSKCFKDSSVNITLVESDAIGTIGVGEATIPSISAFNEQLGIDEDAFVKATNATFKLGIEFADWKVEGEKYFHPFGTYGFDLEGIPFHHYWAKMRAAGETWSLDDYSLNAMAAYEGKFLRPQPEHGTVMRKLAYAFHFDASLYAKFLRSFSEARGVNRKEGKVVKVIQNPENGFVMSVKLEDGRNIEGDLFIDCTGFRGLLVEQTYKTGYTDWSEYLPVNRAVAVRSEMMTPPVPYTRSTALEAGWKWRIPLQQRTGNGYVYCDKFSSPEQAEKILLDGLEDTPLGRPLHLRFVTGMRKKFWTHNCVAIGLSGGFLEPLESTSIHLIRTGIAKLIALFPDKSMPAVERDEYNRLMQNDFTHIRDFLILHYKATRRSGQPFWDYVREMDIPESLETKIKLLRSRGRFFKYDSELFDATSWMAVAVGQGWEPSGYNPVVDGLTHNNIQKSLANIRKVLGKTVAAMPSQQAFIDKFCKAEPL
jgi:tryptophan halogenase